MHSDSRGYPSQDEVNTRNNKNAENDVKIEGNSRRIPLPGRVQNPVHVRDDKECTE
ncbi:MAG: hypothetical protein MJE68_04165 [Proteobacteria bacterium]|nr:hypothetical protein [Pseudomonadota bacterium]